ncbi:MAG: glycosyltransferase [Acidisphaera sp.]|nr:glycosyltransferase [Acidisphaera sp.]MBV9811426.1 glycosyltransferase [Acetobacteraceae bacterium]
MLTVLSVGFPLAPVGPDAVGGSEQVLAALDAALVAAGHRSIVLACEGSVVAGEHISVRLPPEPFNDNARATAWRRVRRQLDRHMATCDIVHLHGLDFHAYLPSPGPPALATMHLPPDWYDPEALHPARPRTWLHGVSHHQHRRLAELAESGRLLPPVQNGVDVERLGAGGSARCDYALMLGRICPEKGQHLALQAAHRADVPLLIGGITFPYPEHRAYFSEQVAPLLDNRRRWLGAVGFDRKRRLLGGARCLLVPSLAPETSSLVAMEALAAGTPVIAFDAGALCEIVDDGRTGFLVAGVDGIVAALARVCSIDRAVCRQVARERFSIARMIEGYFGMYRQLAPQ